MRVDVLCVAWLGCLACRSNDSSLAPPRPALKVDSSSSTLALPSLALFFFFFTVLYVCPTKNVVSLWAVPDVTCTV